MQKYLHMAPFFSAWALNNLKNKEERWQPKYHFCWWDQVRWTAWWESSMGWHRPTYPPSPRHTREAEQNMSSPQVCFPDSSLPRGKEAELNSVYSIILYKITNQIRQLVHFPRGEERRVLCLWRSIFPHRNKEQEKGFIPPTTQATFFAELYL